MRSQALGKEAVPDVGDKVLVASFLLKPQRIFNVVCSLQYFQIRNK